MSDIMDTSSSRKDAQATKQRQIRLDETQFQVDALLQKALAEFVEAHIGPGPSVSHSWCLWECTWQTDTGNLNIFLDCEGPQDTCYLLVSYLPSLTSYNTFQDSLGFVDQQVLKQLCQHLQSRTGLPTRPA